MEQNIIDISYAFVIIIKCDLKFTGYFIKFTIKATIVVLCAAFGQLWAGDYDGIEDGTRKTSCVHVDAPRNEGESNSFLRYMNDTSVIVQDRLSSCWPFFRSHIPSLKKDIICGTGLTISAGFAIGGYFLIEHALDMTDHDYWHSYLHCPKTHSGTSHCELAIASMTWGSMFEVAALVGFTVTSCIWFGPHNDVD